ncbi:MAG TPA: hypothetical protein VKZ95_04580 [Sphingobacteriaceae bacterium]|nr:hypothetical protein [Sphingobacteriaceae bacterium]
MTSKQRIQAFFALGQHLKNDETALLEVISQAKVQNPWFTAENISSAIQSIAENLDESLLERWLSSYSTDVNGYQNKTVGLVLAGNIPMVGFHDILCTLITGFNVQIKLSSDDKVLIPYVLGKLQEIEPLFKKQIQLVERLSKFDIVIATGSNNTSRYFEYYFKDVPHIIRKNRNGIAILTGKENEEQLNALGHDIFDYFGLGCRNISKIYFPKGYHYPTFFEGIESFHDISNHFKYHNNYEYNKSIYLVNGDEHLDNGFLLLKKDERLASPLAVVYFEEYENIDELKPVLEEKKEEIQCIVSTLNLEKSLPVISFGASQSPKLSDYADGIDVIDFLIKQI